MVFNRPSEKEFTSVRNYIEGEHWPVEGEEASYILHKDDLVTLRPGREHAWLDRLIETMLRLLHKPFPFVQGMFCTKASASASVCY